MKQVLNISEGQPAVASWHSAVSMPFVAGEIAKIEAIWLETTGNTRDSYRGRL